MRTLTSHGAQLAALAVRPENALYAPRPPPSVPDDSLTQTSMQVDSDAKSDASFDPLFDDVPDEDTLQKATPMPSRAAQPGRAPKNAPPLLDAATYASFSADILMTAAIDGQVVLWDKRSYSPGRGVGRLWMSERTPPWCLSVTNLYPVGYPAH